MTDEKFVALETIAERADIARSARAGRKGRSIGSACRFNSDYMTKKEMEAMNGEVKTLKLGYFYTWEEFKAFPDSWKVGYINHLLSKYNVGLITISRDLFGLSNSALRTYLTANNLYEQINKHARGFKPNPEEFRKAVAEQRKKPEPSYLQPSDARENLSDDREQPETILMPGSAVYLTVAFDRFDTAAFEGIARMFAGKNVRVAISVSVEENDDE